MKAARLHQVGSSLQIDEIAEPTLKAGGAIVRVISSHILSFTHQVISGELGYMLPELPFVPGTSAIAIVEAVADDVFGLQVGQMVFCDPFIASPSTSGARNGILIGWTGLAADSAQMQSVWKDGVWAEKALLSAECLTPIPESIDPIQLAAIGYLAIPYNGFLKGQLAPGQTVVINGATGGLGAGAVLVALAMGAAKVVAVGRDEQTLTTLVQLSPNRMVSVSLQGSFDEYSQRIQEAANGADLVLDVLGGVTTPEPTLACIRALRPSGTAVFMGGVKAAIPLAYAEIMLAEITVRGAFMYTRNAPRDLLKMASAGTLKLDAIATHTFPLTEINSAISQAATLKGLDYSIISMI